MAGSDHSWKITDVVTGQTVPNGAGNVVVGSYVYFFTGDGNQGSVFIPDTRFTEHHVQQAVREAARKLDRIGRLAEGTIEQAF